MGLRPLGIVACFGLAVGVVALSARPARALPAGFELRAPFPCGTVYRLYCGYSGIGPSGSSCSGFHSGPDVYAIDLNYSFVADVGGDYNQAPKGLGKPLTAAADGVVAFAGLTNGGYGYAVLLRHETSDGVYTTLYAHLQSTAVSQGARVKTGDTIGALGQSGGQSIAHLHFVLRKGGDTFSGTALQPEPLSGATGLKAGQRLTVGCVAPPPPDAGVTLPRDGGVSPPPADAMPLARDARPLAELGGKAPAGDGDDRTRLDPLTTRLYGGCSTGAEGTLPLAVPLLLLGLLWLTVSRRCRRV